MLENIHIWTLWIALTLDANKHGFATFIRKVKQYQIIELRKGKFQIWALCYSGREQNPSAVLKR